MEDKSIMLSTIAECENACATHDAYELSPYIYNLTSKYNSAAQLKLVNTGTIDNNGLYTAPSKEGVYEVKAYSVKFENKSDSAYVVVSASD